MNARPLIAVSMHGRMSAPRVIRAALAMMLMLGLLGSEAARAQSNECMALGKSFQNRQAAVEKVQAFHKSPPTADEACSAFTRLVNLTNELVKSVDENGAWCHVPPDVLPGLQIQAPQIAEARKKACNAAEQQRKAKTAPTHNPFGGGDSVIGGTVKMPKGAL